MNYDYVDAENSTQPDLAQLMQNVKQAPENAQVYIALADAMRKAGRWDEALDIYSRALTLDATAAVIYLGVATIFIARDHLGAALNALHQGLQIDASLAGAHELLASIISQFSPEEYHPELEYDLLQCFEKANIDHQILAGLAASQLFYKYQFQKASCNPVPDFFSPVVLDALSTDTLFFYFLSNTINTDAQMEFVLIALRAHLLTMCKNNLANARQYSSLIAAISLQSFANEYVWAESDNEKNIITDIIVKLKNSFDENNYKIIVCAMYQPLLQITAADMLSSVFKNTESAVAELFEKTVQEPLCEEKIRKEIMSVASGFDASSSDVRAQYEHNPYPRWRALPADKVVSLKKIICQLPGIQLSSVDNSIDSDQPLQVLIAGCGTGFEPISLAMMDPSAQIAALDLSSRSLAYAARMAQKIEANNIRFLQGDILQVDKLQQQFDLINSTGVLHHMQDPEAGWRSLCNILKPGGVMRISLYSELARSRVVNAHKHIDAMNLSSSVEDIKKFREFIFNSPSGSPLHDVSRSDDLYSVSGCRDLLFHVREHRFTWLQIDSMLRSLGLHLLKIDLPHLDVGRQFSMKFPGASVLTDLEKWHQFETEYPDTFVGMYQFWCQKQL